MPDDDDDGVWLAPQTRLATAALDDLMREMAGLPISVPSPRPTQSAQRVHPVAVDLLDVPEHAAKVSLDRIGALRFEILDELGLSEAATVGRRLSELSDGEFDALAYAVLDLAKASFGRLIDQAALADPPVVLWADDESATELLGRTLFWADHYLIADPLADAMLRSGAESEKLAEAIARLLRLRSLIELGIVVPIPSDFATALTARETQRATEQDLDRPELVEWLQAQLIIEGPTAREALLVKVRDDEPMGGDRFFLHGHIVPGSVDDKTRTFTVTYLTAYRPGFDYGPWIAQSRGKVVADALQDMNRSLAVANAFGGAPVTRVPFRARLLRQKEEAVHPASALVWADVPWLPEASAARLAEISREDAAVEALRARARTAFARARTDDFDGTAAELADELAQAARELENEMRTARLWGLVRPAGFGVLSVGLGATTGVFGGLSAVAAAIGSALPTIGQLRQQRSRPAYALVLAKRVG